MRYFLAIAIVFFLILTPAPATQTQATATQAPATQTQTRILTGDSYFTTLHQALSSAKESVYAAMYLIQTAPEARDDPKNPASILIEDLIKAHKRGVRIKVVLDDSNLRQNYNAFRRLKKAGIEAFFDAPSRLLHAKAVVIDSRIAIVGSYNWTRASLSSNIEYAVYTDSPAQAENLINLINNIALSRDIPVSPPEEEGEGVVLPVSLLTSPTGPNLHRLFTSHAHKSFDLYLYLLKKAQAASVIASEPEAASGSTVGAASGSTVGAASGREPTTQIRINYKELATCLGYKDNYYFNTRQPLHKLGKIYGLIKDKRPWSKYLTLVTAASSLPAPAVGAASGREPETISIPYSYWDYGYDKKLSFNGKFLYLVALNEAKHSLKNPYWFRSNKDLALKYHIGESSVSEGLEELERENIVEIYRDRPAQYGAFKDRLANSYRLNPLLSDEALAAKLKALQQKYGEDLVKKAQGLSEQLNEPKDPEKIETYIELIKKYGYNKVAAANSRVAEYRRETGFRSIEQVISLLKQR